MVTSVEIIIAGVAVCVITILINERTRSATLRELLNVVEMVFNKLKEVTLSSLSSITQVTIRSGGKSMSKTEDSPSKLTTRDEVEQTKDRTKLSSCSEFIQAEASAANVNTVKSIQKISFDQSSLDEAEGAMQTAKSMTESLDGSHSTVSLENDDSLKNWLQDDVDIISFNVERKACDRNGRIMRTAQTFDDTTAPKDPEEQRRLSAELAKLCSMAQSDRVWNKGDFSSLNTASISINDSVEDEHYNMQTATPFSESNNSEIENDFYFSDFEMEKLNELNKFIEDLKRGMLRWMQYTVRFDGTQKSRDRTVSRKRKTRSSIDSYFGERLCRERRNSSFCEMEPLRDEKIADLVNPRPLMRSMSAPVLQRQKVGVLPELTSLRKHAAKPKQQVPVGALLTAPVAKSEKKSVDKQEEKSEKENVKGEKKHRSHKHEITKEALLEALAIGMLKINKRNQEIAVNEKRLDAARHIPHRAAPPRDISPRMNVEARSPMKKTPIGRTALHTPSPWQRHGVPKPGKQLHGNEAKLDSKKLLEDWLQQFRTKEDHMAGADRENWKLDMVPNPFHKKKETSKEGRHRTKKTKRSEKNSPMAAMKDIRHTKRSREHRHRRGRSRRSPKGVTRKEKLLFDGHLIKWNEAAPLDRTLYEAIKKTNKHESQEHLKGAIQKGKMNPDAPLKAESLKNKSKKGSPAGLEENEQLYGEMDMKKAKTRQKTKRRKSRDKKEIRRHRHHSPKH